MCICDLGNNFRVFQRFKITLKIKPRTSTGLILAVHGRRDYLVLQMINGTIKFTVDNGKGALSSSFTKDPYDLCDGDWHTIQGEKNLAVRRIEKDFDSCVL
jgi:laminin, alpha 3/5